MIPIGYMYKVMAQRPDWVSASNVEDLYSVSDHGSKDFAKYVHYWRHNGWWLFDHPDTMKKIAQEQGIDVSSMTLFYYEALERQFDESTREWSEFEPEPSFPTYVERPRAARLEGFDVVTFCAGNSPECSPLSCNSLAGEIPVNRHCLFETKDQAKAALETGKFDNTEPGPFRIIAVFTLE